MLSKIAFFTQKFNLVLKLTSSNLTAVSRYHYHHQQRSLVSSGPFAKKVCRPTSSDNEFGQKLPHFVQNRRNFSDSSSHSSDFGQKSTTSRDNDEENLHDDDSSISDRSRDPHHLTPANNHDDGSKLGSRDSFDDDDDVDHRSTNRSSSRSMTSSHDHDAKRLSYFEEDDEEIDDVTMSRDRPIPPRYYKEEYHERGMMTSSSRDRHHQHQQQRYVDYARDWSMGSSRDRPAAANKTNRYVDQDDDDDVIDRYDHRREMTSSRDSRNRQRYDDDDDDVIDRYEEDRRGMTSSSAVDYDQGARDLERSDQVKAGYDPIKKAKAMAEQYLNEPVRNKPKSDEYHQQKLPEFRRFVTGSNTIPVRKYTNK